MRFTVKLNDKNNARPDQIFNGYLGSDGRKITYPRGEAIKKARMFGGKIESVVDYVVDTLKVGQITRNSLTYGLEQELDKRKVYGKVRATLSNEIMVYGNVFDDLIVEHNKGEITLDAKALAQCKDIAESVTDYQYVHIIEG